MIDQCAPEAPGMLSPSHAADCILNVHVSSWPGGQISPNRPRALASLKRAPPVKVHKNKWLFLRFRPHFLPSRVRGCLRSRITRAVPNQI